VLLGLGLSALAAVPVVAASRPSLAAGVPALLTGAALLYMGSQPVRLGVGWWLRIERALEVPGLLPSAGAPTVPAVRGIDLALALAPAAGLALLVALLGRGVRGAYGETAPLRLPRRPAVELGAAGEATVLPTHRLVRSVFVFSGRARARARRLALGLAAAALLEAAAIALSVFLVLEGLRLGFL
jgi:hypothetical protein